MVGAPKGRPPVTKRGPPSGPPPSSAKATVVVKKEEVNSNIPKAPSIDMFYNFCAGKPLDALVEGAIPENLAIDNKGNNDFMEDIDADFINGIGGAVGGSSVGPGAPAPFSTETLDPNDETVNPNP